MGVSITAFSHMVKADTGHEREGSWCYADSHVTAFAYRQFEASFDGLDPTNPPGFGDLPPSDPASFEKFVGGHCYTTTDATTQSRVMGDSYGGYNRWRAAVTRSQLGVRPQAVWDDPAAYAGSPFVEVIHFADTEGCIGPNAAARLHAAFTAAGARDRFTGWLDDNADGFGEAQWMIRDWDAWAEGTALAAQSGLIRFA